MRDANRRVYAPALEPDEYVLEEADGERRRNVLLAVIAAVIVLALGSVAWNVYGQSGPPPLIEAQKGDYKTLAPEVAPAGAASHELDDAIAGDDGAPAPDASAAAPVAAAVPAGPPVFVPFAPQSRGGFVVQLGALRSSDQAEGTWRAFMDRAPNLARGAHTEIQRADLGAQGVYYRLRVGYFDTQARAGEYCAQAKAAGQDCMVVSQ